VDLVLRAPRGRMVARETRRWALLAQVGKREVDDDAARRRER